MSQCSSIDYKQNHPVAVEVVGDNTGTNLGSASSNGRRRSNRETQYRAQCESG